MECYAGLLLLSLILNITCYMTVKQRRLGYAVIIVDAAVLVLAAPFFMCTCLVYGDINIHVFNDKYIFCHRTFI